MAMPPLVDATDDDLARIVATRRWPGPEGLRLAADRGVLRIAPAHLGHRCWCLVDATRTGQARRMDGEPWAVGRKAMTFKGGDGAWPIGIGAIRASDRLVVLCEGMPDTMAALWFVHAEGRNDDAWAACIPGVSQRIAPDAALALRRVPRLVLVLQGDVDVDATVGRWQACLRRDVESWHPGDMLGGQGKDLADVLARPDLVAGHLAPASRTHKAAAPSWTLTGEPED